MKDNVIVDKSFKFALLVVDLYKFLKNKQKEYILSKQLLRSETSIGANIEEAQAAQSKKEFIAKMSISAKEARETRYWIKLLKESGYIDEYGEKDQILEDINIIIALLTKIIKTAQESMKENSSNV